MTTLAYMARLQFESFSSIVLMQAPRHEARLGCGTLFPFLSPLFVRINPAVTLVLHSSLRGSFTLEIRLALLYEGARAFPGVLRRKHSARDFIFDFIAFL